MLKILKWVSFTNSFFFPSYLANIPTLSLTLITVELQALAHEVQALVQAKIGTTAYSAVHSSIRQKMAERRNERKTTLALQVRSFSYL